MAERRRRLVIWLLPRLLIFAAGVAVGYYARDREAGQLRQTYEQTLSELEELRQAGEDAIERGRRAGEDLRAGAQAAADSTRAAVEEITGKGN
jgi:glutamate dehydrogenase/leucine dehydrogenase